MFILCEPITYIHACWTTKYIKCCHCIVTFIKERRTNTHARTLIHTFRSLRNLVRFFCCMCLCSLCLCVVVVVVVVFFISLCYLALISNSFNFRLCATAAAVSRVLIYYIIYWAAVACVYVLRVPNQMKSNQIENQAKMKCLHVLWSAVVASSVDGVVVVFGPFHKKTFSFIVAHVCIAYTYWLISRL